MNHFSLSCIRKYRNKDKVIPTKMKQRRHSKSKQSDIQLTKRKSSLKRAGSSHRKRSSLIMSTKHIEEESTPLFGQRKHDYNDSDEDMDEQHQLLQKRPKKMKGKQKKGVKIASNWK